MNEKDHHPFSEQISVFHGRHLPERGLPAGYAALISAFDLTVPLPIRLSAIGEKHRVYEADNWRLFTPRHAPEPTVEGHLVFALKYEGLDLTVLRRLFLIMGPEPVTAFVRAKPTSAYARRLWFLHEWLLDTRLNIPDTDRGSYVPVVDPKQQFATEGVLSPRHRVRDNLPGTPDFCPLVCRTESLQALVARGLKERAREAVAAVPKDVPSRAAAVLAFGFVYIHPFEDGNGRLNRYLIRHNSL